MKRAIFFILFFAAFAVQLHAQNGCAAAVTLTPGTQQCGNSAGNAGDFPGVANPCNGFYDDDEYWFAYTGNGVNGLQLDLSSLTNTYAGLFVLDACAGNCVASNTNGSSTADLTVTTPVLNNGQTYYIVIANWGLPNNTAFCLDAQVIVPPPAGAGDGCAAAVSLTPGTQQCANSAGNAGDFPNAGGAPANPCNSSYNDDEYWFSYTGNGVDGLQLDLSNISDTYAGLFVFDACPSSSPNCIASATNGSSTADLSALTPVLNNGQTYYIVIVNWGAPDNTAFCLDATIATPATPPANDDCAGATPIGTSVDSTCATLVSGTTAAASSSLTACTGTANNDVWFSFVASNCQHTVTLSNVTGTIDLVHEVFSGSCASLTSMTCSDPNTSTTNGFVPGNTYFVRVHSYTSGQGDSDFDICITSPNPYPITNGNVTCDSMAPICTSNVLSYSAEASGVNAEPCNDYDCLTTQPDPTWYYFEISQAGNLVFDIAAGSDVDFATWGPYPNLTAARSNCGALPAPIDCSYSISATEQLNIPGVQVGEVYILIITNYAGVVQTITAQTSASNTAGTNCNIVTNPSCDADAGAW